MAQPNLLPLPIANALPQLPSNENTSRTARRYSQREVKHYPNIEMFRALPSRKSQAKSTVAAATSATEATFDKANGCAGRTPTDRSAFVVADVCAISWGCLLLPYFFIIYLYIYILMFPFCCIVKIYGSVQPKPNPRIKRNPSFAKFASICLFFLLPVLPVVILNVSFMAILSVVVTFPVGICTIGWSQISKNNELLGPFREFGQWSIYDVICAIIGAQYRQGLCEFHASFTAMLTFDPFLKWFMIANPYLHRLEERFKNQWTLNLDSMTREEVHLGLYRSVSFAMHVDKLNRDFQDDRFAAHYQIPPEEYPIRTIPNSGGVSGQCAIGYQSHDWIAHMTLTCHPKEGLYSPRSKTGHFLVYSVYLSYWNPFHMLTGYIEVSERPNQSLENPMWCIVGDSWMAVELFRSFGTIFFGYAAEVSEEAACKNVGGLGVLADA